MKGWFLLKKLVFSELVSKCSMKLAFSFILLLTFLITLYWSMNSASILFSLAAYLRLHSKIISSMTILKVLLVIRTSSISWIIFEAALIFLLQVFASLSIQYQAEYFFPSLFITAPSTFFFPAFIQSVFWAFRANLCSFRLYFSYESIPTAESGRIYFWVQEYPSFFTLSFFIGPT